VGACPPARGGLFMLSTTGSAACVWRQPKRRGARPLSALRSGGRYERAAGVAQDVEERLQATAAAARSVPAHARLLGAPAAAPLPPAAHQQVARPLVPLYRVKEGHCF